MKIATWNVNSLKVRLPRVEAWIREHQPDVLVMQETKCADAAFPTAVFGDLGYASTHHGNGRWNGVAILSRVGLEDARAGFTGEDAGSLEECRIVQATCAGVKVMSVYVPNGRSVESEFFEQKLAWLGQLRRELDLTCQPDDAVAILGDFNIAPEDRDVWDITQFEGMTHVTPAERAALEKVESWGLSDAMRVMYPEGTGPFTWWDYRAGAFHKGWGMRIDLALVSEPVLARLSAAYRDRDARKGPQPSDHAPVVIELSDPD
jgi:exodeoxyribonuclease III